MRVSRQIVYVRGRLRSLHDGLLGCDDADVAGLVSAAWVSLGACLTTLGEAGDVEVTQRWRVPGGVSAMGQVAAVYRGLQWLRPQLATQPVALGHLCEAMMSLCDALASWYAISLDLEVAL